LLEETLRLNEEVLETVRKLMEKEKQGGADFILARTEVFDARAQVGPGRSAAKAAHHDLRRALGVTDDAIMPKGSLERPVVVPVLAVVAQAALEQRADLHAREAAVAEAEARLRLEIANRFGNPNIGPNYEIDAARVSNIGGQITLPLPVCNKH